MYCWSTAAHSTGRRGQYFIWRSSWALLARCLFVCSFDRLFVGRLFQNNFFFLVRSSLSFSLVRQQAKPELTRQLISSKSICRNISAPTIHHHHHHHRCYRRLSSCIGWYPLRVCSIADRFEPTSLTTKSCNELALSCSITISPPARPGLANRPKVKATCVDPDGRHVAQSRRRSRFWRWFAPTRQNNSHRRQRRDEPRERLFSD